MYRELFFIYSGYTCRRHIISIKPIFTFLVNKTIGMHALVGICLKCVGLSVAIFSLRSFTCELNFTVYLTALTKTLKTGLQIRHSQFKERRRDKQYCVRPR